MGRAVGLIFIPFIPILFACFDTFSQGVPQACVNYPSEYQYIDNSVFSGIDDVNCEKNVVKNLKLSDSGGSTAEITDAHIFFGIDDSFVLGQSSGIDISYTTQASHNFPKGETWVLLTGEIGGQKVLSCKNYEFLETFAPIIIADMCSGNPVSLEIGDNLNRDGFKVNWGDGEVSTVNSSGTVTETTHTYTNYYDHIAVEAFYLRNGIEVCKSDSAVANREIPEPVFLSHLIGLNDASEFKIKYLGNLDIEHVIEGRELDGSWREMSVAEAGEGTIIGLNPQKKYCFRIKMKNSCGDIFYSENNLCNVVIDREVISNSSMLINWNLPEEPTAIPDSSTLSRKSALTSTTKDWEQVFSNPSTIDFVDDSLICNKSYYYKVGLAYPPVDFKGTAVAVEISTSNIPKVISDSRVDVKPPYMAMASFDPFDETKVDFAVGLGSKDFKLVDSLYFYSSDSELGTFKKVSEGVQTKYSETGVQIGEGGHCFKYQIKDICGITTAVSDAFCTISLNEIEENLLTWRAFVAPDEVYDYHTPPLYSIEYLDSLAGGYSKVSSQFSDTTFNMESFLENWAEPVLRLRILQNQKVSFGDNADFALNAYSNVVEYKVKPMIFAPTAFTPDGRGPNESESFKPLTKYVKEGSFKVLDRFGNLIFQSKDLDDAWDGTLQSNHKPAAVGNYFYLVSAFAYDGSPINYKGAIALLR